MIKSKTCVLTEFYPLLVDLNSTVGYDLNQPHKRAEISVSITLNIIMVLQRINVSLWLGAEQNGVKDPKALCAP
jgi:hypothetical protein